MQAAHPGTSGGNVTFEAGRAGQAFVFDGRPANYITVHDDSLMQPATNQLTIAAWIKPDFSASNVFDTVLAKRDGCGTAAISYILAVAKVGSGTPLGEVSMFMTRSDLSGAYVRCMSEAVVPNDGRFHHVAGTYDGATVRTYLDGVLAGSIARCGPIVLTASAPVIGDQGGTCGVEAVAAIDEIQYFDRALSDRDIAALAGLAVP